MAGTSLLVCREFVESDDFMRSRADLLEETGLTIQQLDDRLEAVEWALARGDNDEEAWVRPVPGRRIWVAVIPRGIPPLRLYLRPCDSVEHKCEWLWIEERV
jgi:hypothetical protein